MNPYFWAVLTAITLIPACQWREDCKDADGVARLHADPAFPPVEQDAIQRAAVRWNVFAGHTAVQVQRESLDFICTILDSPATDLDGRGAQGLHRSATGNIEIAVTFNCAGESRARGIPCLESILMHEMGHLLGLGHLPDGDSGIMQPVGATPDFTSSDRRACEAILVCRY